MSKVTQAFRPMQLALERINLILDLKGEQIRRSVGVDLFPQLERAITMESIINLTDYKATNSEKRDETIELAFDILKDLAQFEWNESGSFTRNGAWLQFKKDVNFSKNSNKLTVAISGKLLQLEEGVVNWNALKRFFYNPKMKGLIEDRYHFADEFYEALRKLLQKTGDDPRPYISQALTDGREFMDELLKYEIDKIFGGQGTWLQ